MLLLGVFVTAWLGFACLALSQGRHWRQVVGTTSPRRGRVRLLRGVGAGLLTGSLALALLRDGASFGSLLWATVLSFAALALAFTLAWRPQWLSLFTRLIVIFRPERLADRPKNTQTS